MPPSQLKQLKASLHNSGIIGQQKSKKQRKANSKDAQTRSQRRAALDDIREKFNPFEAKAPARKDKFDIASSRPVKKTIERPGIARGLGEERRKATLLKEMQARNKVGGMLDRRFGEDDPNMTPEQKAAERFAQQALRSSKKNDLFNLENDLDEELHLTHGGRVLGVESEEQSLLHEDFDEPISVSESDAFDDGNDRPRKRARLGDESDTNGEDNEIVRRKTKKEVMQEVISKSKAYKAARQAQKEDDDDLRAELDRGMKNVFADLVQGAVNKKLQLPSPPTDSEPVMDPGRAALLAGKTRAEADKEYEANVREMKIEARSKPSTRSKTDEEKAAEDKAKLEEMETQRLRRMHGESISSDEDEVESTKDALEEQDEVYDDAGAFGLDQPVPRYIPNLTVEEEDEFVIDDIILGDSEADMISEKDSQDTDEDLAHSLSDDGEDDFINGLVLPPESDLNSRASAGAKAVPTLPFTFPCPQTLQEVVDLTASMESGTFPTIIQRIRALYHKGLAEGNNDKLAAFSQTLLPWIVMQVRNPSAPRTPMSVIEQLLRHLHSMAKAYPREVAGSFREHMRGLVQQTHTALDAGDLIVFTAVANIFPTSDLWHSVVSPAMLLLARYLGQAILETQTDIAQGIYVCSLALRYQNQSTRYVPEVVNFLSKLIQLLLPVKLGAGVKSANPSIIENISFYIRKKADSPPQEPLPFDSLYPTHSQEISAESFLLASLNLVGCTTDLYQDATSWPEICAPLRLLVESHVLGSSNQPLLHQITISTAESLLARLSGTSDQIINSRKPLLLHNHKPLAIKSSYPHFDDQYNPTRKQRDPDADRAELNKLKAEHRKERKGAMRELRKDANFMAREQLREKRAKDEAYDKKFKKLVAEIQSEEGREAKSYERERAKRKGRF